MKELTIEEKAKRYDEALERAKKWYNAPNVDKIPTFGNRVIEEIFPELKESEDERIGKEIRDFICWATDRGSITREQLEKSNSWLAWLEKQGERKPAVDTKVIIPKFRVGDIVKIKSQPMLSPRKIISIGLNYYLCEDRGCIGFAWEDDCEIVEQKPAWSEEDKDYYDAIIAKLEVTQDNAALTDNQMEFLKSLKDRAQPQSHWKPSDEQMDALANALSLAKSCGEEGAFDLRTLYEQLNELKG